MISILIAINCTINQVFPYDTLFLLEIVVDKMFYTSCASCAANRMIKRVEIHDGIEGL